MQTIAARRLMTSNSRIILRPTRTHIHTTRFLIRILLLRIRFLLIISSLLLLLLFFITIIILIRTIKPTLLLLLFPRRRYGLTLIPLNNFVQILRNFLLLLQIIRKKIAPQLLNLLKLLNLLQFMLLLLLLLIFLLIFILLLLNILLLLLLLLRI